MAATSRETLVIIGSGPAAWTAALYAARADLRPLVFEGEPTRDMIPGGQLMWTTDIENYPGFPEGLGGQELMQRMRDQATRFGARVVTENIESVDFSRRPFELVKSDGVRLEAMAVIVATGARPYRPGDVDFSHPRIFDSDTILDLPETPRSISIQVQMPDTAFDTTRFPRFRSTAFPPMLSTRCCTARGRSRSWSTAISTCSTSRRTRKAPRSRLTSSIAPRYANRGRSAIMPPGTGHGPDCGVRCSMAGGRSWRRVCTPWTAGRGRSWRSAGRPTE